MSPFGEKWLRETGEKQKRKKQALPGLQRQRIEARDCLDENANFSPLRGQDRIRLRTAHITRTLSSKKRELKRSRRKSRRLRAAPTRGHSGRQSRPLRAFSRAGNSRKYGAGFAGLTPGTAPFVRVSPETKPKAAVPG